jgi:hypothetical protein
MAGILDLLLGRDDRPSFVEETMRQYDQQQRVARRGDAYVNNMPNPSGQMLTATPPTRTGILGALVEGGLEYLGAPPGVQHDAGALTRSMAEGALLGTLDKLDSGDVPGALEYLVGGPALGIAKKALPTMAAKVTSDVISELPMDEASRMARAKKMGFRENMPLYHGSDADFSAFDLAKRGSTTGVAPARVGAAWLAFEPEVADQFADLAAKARGGNPTVYPLVHRASNPAVATLKGTETNLEIAATLEDAFERGYDAVWFKNYTAPDGQTGKNVLVVRDPEQLRSRFAKFDPAKRSSSDLLAGLGGVGATGLLGLMMNQNAPSDRQEP